MAVGFELQLRAVARSENPGGLVVLGGDNVSPLVKIGLTDQPKTGGAKALPAPPLATALHGRDHLVYSVVPSYNDMMKFRPSSMASFQILIVPEIKS